MLELSLNEKENLIIKKESELKQMEFSLQTKAQQIASLEEKVNKHSNSVVRYRRRVDPLMAEREGGTKLNWTMLICIYILAAKPAKGCHCGIVSSQ